MILLPDKKCVAKVFDKLCPFEHLLKITVYCTIVLSLSKQQSMKHKSYDIGQNRTDESADRRGKKNEGDTSAIRRT